MNLATPTKMPGDVSGPQEDIANRPAIAAPPSLAEVAQRFPHLEIIEYLGRGGMGMVYKARQARLDRYVAVKILAKGKETDHAFAERFVREARALARLNHPNIVAVHDFGETDGNYYLVMEYVDGTSLRLLLHQLRITPKEALAIVPRICDALQYAHEQGVVHRDIKPENILVDKQGRVKIADFGLAKLLGVAPSRERLTEAQQVVGTPHYMAPEQTEHPQEVDHRADIYSLGVVFYEMLTGELPLGRFPSPSQKVSVDVRLDEVVLRALEKEPERRYQQAVQVKTDVETIAGTRPPAARAASSVQAKQAHAPWASAGRRKWWWLLAPAGAAVAWLAFQSISPTKKAVTNLPSVVDTMPPVVVNTVPQSGACEVPTGVTEIKVRFSKPMTDGSWSWSSAWENSVPDSIGKPSYSSDGRTCTLKVRLEAGRTYAYWLNSDSFHNFKDQERRPAVPYLLVFQTQGDGTNQPDQSGGTAAGAQPGGAAQFAQALDALWEDMDMNYSYFALKPDVDWRAIHERARPRAEQARSLDELQEVLIQMLAPLKDMHVWIERDGERVATWRNPWRRNFNLEVITDAISEPVRVDEFATVGTTKADGFGYLLINRQSAATESNVRQTVAEMRKRMAAPGFLVDLRVGCNGGDELLARELAQVFCAKDTVYAMSKYRGGPAHDDFTQDHPRTIAASETAYTKPVVCLIGHACVSSGEGLVKMMRCLPHVTTVGEPTRGASGNPAPFRLSGLDLQVWYSRWVDMLPDGKPIEGAGIAPAIEVRLPIEAYNGRDPTLEKAVEILRAKVRSETNN